MGYTQVGEFEDLFPEDLPERVAVETTRRVVEELEEEVVERTPVAKIPQAYSGNAGRWVRDRGGRTPGTLKESWEKTEVRVRSGPAASGSVFTDDPAAPHVENDTVPHLIRARKPGGTLRFPAGAQFLYRKQVSHPGTTGVHMMRDALGVLEARWPIIAQEVLEEIAAAAERGIPRRFV